MTRGDGGVVVLDDLIEDQGGFEGALVVDLDAAGFEVPGFGQECGGFALAAAGIEETAFTSVALALVGGLLVVRTEAVRPAALATFPADRRGGPKGRRGGDKGQGARGEGDRGIGAGGRGRGRHFV